MLSIRASLLVVFFGLLLAVFTGDAVAQEQDHEEFAAAVNSASDQVEALQGLSTVTAENVQIVSTSDLAPQEEVANLVEAAQADDTGLEALRTALSENDSIAVVLEENEHAVDDIIAIHVSDDGHVTLYAHTE